MSKKKEEGKYIPISDGYGVLGYCYQEAPLQDVEAPCKGKEDKEDVNYAPGRSRAFSPFTFEEAIIEVVEEREGQ